MTPTLSSLPFLRDLPFGIMDAVLTRAVRHELVAGVRLIVEGQRGESLFFLARGEVRVVHGPNRQVLATLAAPTLFGEMALVADVPRTADVLTFKGCTAYEVTRRDVDTLSQVHPELRQTILSFHRFRLMDNLLRANPLFSALDVVDREALARRFACHAVAAGDEVLQQGEACRELFVILRGRFQMLRRERDQLRVCGVLSEGDVFGEASLVLFNRPAATTIRAVTPGIVLNLDRASFQQHIMAVATVRTELIRLALARERRLDLIRRGIVDVDAHRLPPPRPHYGELATRGALDGLLH